ncbi:MAG: hypothetical protein HY858_00765 [Candidatus Solibacter usitatus]|nr:hypothetical protein [Candidatus Solibacter usitatus]
MTIQVDARTPLIAYLAEHTPAKWIGRTALMKYCYFLQTLRMVPLGYNFSLYSYGPFDSAVLSDLGEAEALGMITETPLPTGYGYKIKNALSDEDMQELAGRFLKEHKADVDWVIEEFGGGATSDLELDSTIIYVDREEREAGRKLSMEDLTHRVREVKPRFPESTIRKHVEALSDKELLLAIES